MKNRISGQYASVPNGRANGAERLIAALAAPTADDLRAARVILRLRDNRKIARQNLIHLRSFPEWTDLLKHLESTAVERRIDELANWLRMLHTHVCTSERAVAMQLALNEVTLDVAAHPDDPDIRADSSPEVWSLDMVPSHVFFEEEHETEWAIEGISVLGESSVTAGPTKSLKTTLLIEKSIALASATPFLGRFDVPRPLRVGLISGESGRRIIQANARAICLAHGIEDPRRLDILWGFKLPQLTISEHIEVLRKTVADNGLEYVGLDPFYLTVMVSKSGIDSNNMYQMGMILNEVSQAISEAGAMVDIAHHFVKRREDPYAAPELGDLSGAGIGQWMRQWFLVGPRQPFDAEAGTFYLQFVYGGSAGHSGHLAADITVGKLSAMGDERRWEVTLATASQERLNKQQQRQEERQQEQNVKRAEKAAEEHRKRRDRMAQVVEILSKLPGQQATENQIRTATGWNSDTVKHILYTLTEDAHIHAIESTVTRGKGATYKVTAYVLNPGAEVVL